MRQDLLGGSRTECRVLLPQCGLGCIDVHVHSSLLLSKENFSRFSRLPLEFACPRVSLPLNEAFTALQHSARANAWLSSFAGESARTQVCVVSLADGSSVLMPRADLCPLFYRETRPRDF